MSREENKLRSPLDNASFISRLFFSWCGPLIKLGSRRPLEEDDIYHLPENHTTGTVFLHITTAWKNDVKKYGSHASFRRAAWNAYWMSYLESGICYILFMITMVIQPFLIGALLTYVSAGEVDFIGITSGVGIALLLGAISIISTFSMNYGFYITTRLCIYLRSSAIALIFQKSLRLSSASKGKHTTGEIVTLMSVDSERVVQGVMIIQWLWMGPTLIIVAMILLVLQVQWSALAGAGTMLLITYLQKFVSEMVGKTRRQLVQFTDERVKVMNETLQGIRVVKLYAWETPIRDRIESIRYSEVAKITSFQLLKLINTLSLFVAPLLVAFAVFISYTATGGTLTVDKVYTIYAILSIIRLPVTIMPMAMSARSEMMVSYKRITDFLLLEEIEQQSAFLLTATGSGTGNNGTNHNISNIKSHSDAGVIPPLRPSSQPVTMSRDIVIDIKGADFSWLNSVETTADKICLHDINLQILQGEFIAVVGTVGSGKSSLIAAILGQMYRLHGEQQRLNGNVAYVNQEHWIQNRCLRDNVLFDTPMDEERYADVLDAAELSKDILNLPNADDTEIGERGINLSGGQKARVSIARALYAANTDMYIFDDPLAAVDAHVGKSIFEGAFCSMLRDKCRIVVLSSNYHLLPRFDKIAVVLDGRVMAFDSYSEIIQKYPQYESMETDNNIGNNNSNNNISNKRSEQAEPRKVVTQTGDVTDVIDRSLSLSLRTETVSITTCEMSTTCNEKDERNEMNTNNNNNDNDESKKMIKQLLQPSIQSFEINQQISSRNTNTNTKTSAISTKKMLVKFQPISQNQQSNEYKSSKSDKNSSSYQQNKSYKFRDNLVKFASIKESGSSSKALVGVEDREKGAVSTSTFSRYFAGAIFENVKDGNSWMGLSFLLAMIAMFAIAQTIRVIADYWVGFWAQDQQRKDGTTPSQTQAFYIQWYIVIVVACTVVGMIRSVGFIIACMRSSRNVHSTVLSCVLNAPINLYFDVTPMGRILNRFSKDLDAMDSLLPDTFLQNIQNSMIILSVLIVCIVSSYYFIVIMIPIGYLFIRIMNFYRKSSREMKRLEGVSRSPMYSLFEEVLQGLSTIRAYGRQELMLQRHFECTDRNTKCYFIFWMASRWLALRLDFVSTSVIVAIALISVIQMDLGGIIDANVLGLALVYSLQLTGMLQWSVRMVVETENNMTSVERLLAFTDIPSEAPSELSTDPAPNEWPLKGDLEIRNLSMRYRPGLGRVLYNMNMQVPGGSKVGVCGRTGAGKSSLMLALFRLVEPEESSEITIDGVDILSLGLKCLRSGLTIIPQDPVMFSGTLRYNLDPFSVFSDEEIWTALERAQLKQDILDKFPDKLSHRVSERGENVSLGQRQLLCIARALLRRSKVIIMDEATASVDTATDEKIQKTVRNEFRDCTVLTIAHRLETIADSDIIVVMSEGRIAEQGSPETLLCNEDGLFRGLVDELGPERKEALLLQSARGKKDKGEYIEL